MMKDYVLAGAGEREEDFVADFWNERWLSQEQTKRPKRVLSLSEEWRFLRRVIPDLESCLFDVLDCGCGLGDWTLFLKGLRHRVVGIDIARDMVSRLQEQYGDHFCFGDFRSLDFPENSFDLIINFGGLEHFEEGPIQSILEAWRVLRPRGWFVVTTPHHNLRHFLRDTLGNRTTGPRYPVTNYRFYQYRFTKAELRAYLQSSGFKNVRSRIIAGPQGMNRVFQHELGRIAGRLPRKVQTALAYVGGFLFRPFIGHMVICAGMKSVKN